MSKANKLPDEFTNSDYMLVELMDMTIERMRGRLEDGKIFFNKRFYKLIPKFLFRHKIMISEELKSLWINSQHRDEWYSKSVKEIISGVNNNTKSGSMLVLYDPDSSLNGDYSRICFLRKEDAAAFKLYFK